MSSVASTARTAPSHPGLFLTGAPALTPLPLWVYQTLEDKAEVATHSQSREAVPFRNQRGPQISYEDKELPVLNLTFPQGGSVICTPAARGFSLTPLLCP